MLKDQMLKILRDRHPKLAAMATATDAGRPAIAVLAYAVQDDGTIILSTHQSSHKWKNLQGNPEAGLVVGWDFDQPHVQLGGSVTLLTEDAAAEVEAFFFEENPQAEAFKTPDTGFIAVTPTWCRVTEFQPDGPPKVTEGALE